MPEELGLWTPRKREILLAIGLGFTDGQIAEHFRKSVHTIQAHKKRMAADLDCSTKDLQVYAGIYQAAVGQPEAFYCPP